MEFRSRKAEYFHMVFAFPKEVAADIQANLERQRFLFDIAILKLQAHQEALYWTIGEESQHIATDFDNPIYIQLLFHIEDARYREGFTRQGAVQLMREKADEISSKVHCSFYSVFCPFSVYSDMKNNALSELQKGYCFKLMNDHSGKKYSVKYPRPSALGHNKLLIEIQKDKPAGDQRWKQYCQILNEPYGSVLHRIADIMDHGNEHLDVTTSGSRFTFENTPLMPPNQVAVEQTSMF